MNLMREDGVWRPAADAGERQAAARAPRELKQRVKTAQQAHRSPRSAGSSASSTIPMSPRAKREGYRSRAAYKLIEIDDKYRLLKPGQRVVDLGAAPGGWAQVAAKRVGAAEGKGRVVGIDLLPIETLPGVEFIAARFHRRERRRSGSSSMLGGPADVVLSDMAANTTGHRKTDHLRIMGLAEAAAEFARDVLAPGRRLRRQGAAGRHRGRAPRRSEARLRHRAPRQARREPAGFGGALCAGDGVSKDSLSRLRDLCRISSAPLRGRVSRWVPGRIPLSLHAPGKAVERAAPKPSTALSRTPSTQRSGVEGDPGPSARTRREAAPNSAFAEVSLERKRVGSPQPSPARGRGAPAPRLSARTS